jgi:quercetin dioxygenase-like cupin family protein
MKIQNVPFTITDWTQITSIEHPGEKGKATWRTQEIGNLRIRMVEYTPGYRADHWCTRGHVVLVLEGELWTELGDGRKFLLQPGMTYEVSSEVGRHKSSTMTGAKLFIID